MCNFNLVSFLWYFFYAVLFYTTVARVPLIYKIRFKCLWLFLPSNQSPLIAPPRKIKAFLLENKRVSFIHSQPLSTISFPPKMTLSCSKLLQMPFSLQYKHNISHCIIWCSRAAKEVVVNVQGTLDAQNILLMSIVSAIATGGKCHSYQWRTGGWSNNERVVWCQRSDGVNVTGEQLLCSSGHTSGVTAKALMGTRTETVKLIHLYKYRYLCISGLMQKTAENVPALFFWSMALNWISVKSKKHRVIFFSVQSKSPGYVQQCQIIWSHKKESVQ